MFNLYIESETENQGSLNAQRKILISKDRTTSNPIPTRSTYITFNNIKAT